MVLNAVYKADKQLKIYELIEKNPEVSFDEILKQLYESNFTISLYEKTFVLKSQIAYIDLLLTNYRQKISKDPKNIAKVEKYVAIKEKVLNDLKNTEEQFQFLFSKPINYYYY